MRRTTGVVLIGLMLAAFGCGNSGTPSATAGGNLPSPGASANASGMSGSPAASGTPLSVEDALKPDVAITYPPRGGDALPAGDVLVALTVRSFSIVAKGGAKPVKGSGHVVYYLDVGTIPTKAGVSAATSGEGSAAASTQTSHTWKGVKAGRHVLGVQLVNNDDTPLSPPVTDELVITVK